MTTKTHHEEAHEDAVTLQRLALRYAELGMSQLSVALQSAALKFSKVKPPKAIKETQQSLPLASESQAVAPKTAAKVKGA